MAHVPPFLMTDATAKGDTCKRSHSGDEGTTLDTRPGPDGELHLVYRTQFRFYRIWETQAQTPCWSGGIDKKDLQKAVADGTNDSLAAADRMVQVEWNDQTNVRVGKARLAMVLGNSKAKRKAVWFPVSKRLPKSLHLTDRDWKWSAPRREPDSAGHWGLRGDATLRLDPFCPGGAQTHYKLVTVWQRWEYGSMKGKKKYSLDMCTLPPGTYAGYVQGMPKLWGNRQKLKQYPSIVVAWEWTPQAADSDGDAATAKKKSKADPNWTAGALGWKLKNPKSTKRTGGIYVHPGNKPAWFLGCLGPGPIDEQAEWGFEKRSDTEAAMWEILKAVGVTEKDYLARYQPPRKKDLKWFVIRVEAANTDVVAGDGWNKQSVWLH
jgi:hypothetical protein